MTKNKQRNTITFVAGFNDENLFKKEIIFGKDSIKLYYSQKTIDYIKEGNFDMMFVDGTHLKRLKKSQIILVRFYSTNTSTVVTGMYALSSSKKSEAYSNFFTVLKDLGALDQCRYLTTDFELVIQKGYKAAVKAPTTFRYCFFHLMAATRKYAPSINKTINIENQLRSRLHRLITPNLFRFFSFLVFIRKPYQQSMFKVFKFIVQRFNRSLANELFIAYFGSTYIHGPLSKHFMLDFEHSQIITNNFVEGLNSSLKRHNRGRVNVDVFLDWMKIDSKQIIMNLSDLPKKKLSSNPKFASFHSSFESHGDFLKIIVDYIEETIRKSSIRNEKDNSIGCANEKLAFSACLRGVRLQWSEKAIVVVEKTKTIYSVLIDARPEDEDSSYWHELEPDFSSYLKRLRQK